MRRKRDYTKWSGLSVYVCLSEAEGNDIKPSTYKTRKCLRCEESFESANNGNRICESCNRKGEAAQKAGSAIKPVDAPISDWTLL